MKKQLKTVMILGASNGQIPFIKICKQKNCRVIVVSINGNYPGFELADKCFYIDTRDKDTILKVAREEKIDAILTDQTDVSVPSVAYVSEKLGLRSIGYERAKVFSNKYLMRSAAKKLNVGVPDFCEAQTAMEAIELSKDFTYPLIIKPVDSSGSRGVRKVNTPDELAKYFEMTKAFSLTGNVIVEEFITGKEYLADGIALGGKFINLDLGVKEYFDKPGMYISKMCMFTSAAAIDDPVGISVLEANRTLAEGFGLPFGLTHAEYLVRESDKKVFLVEIAARGGGVFLSSDLTPRACGFDTNRMLIDYVIDGKCQNLSNLKLATDTAAWICFELHPGTVKEIIGEDETRAIDGVFMVNISDIKPGTHVDATMDDTSKRGPVLIHAKSREQCQKIIDKVRQTLDVVTSDDNGTEYHIVW